VTEVEAADKNQDAEEITSEFRCGYSQFATARRTDVRAKTETSLQVYSSSFFWLGFRIIINE
jgi:hypothetical protein